MTCGAILSSSPSCLSTPARRCARAHAVCLCRGAPPRRIRRVHSSWRPDPSRPGRRSRWEDASCRCLPDGSMAGAEEPTPLPGSAAGSYLGSSTPPKKPVEGGSHRAALVTGRAPPTLGSSAAPRAGPPAPVRGTPVMLPYGSNLGGRARCRGTGRARTTQRGESGAWVGERRFT